MQSAERRYVSSRTAVIDSASACAVATLAPAVHLAAGICARVRCHVQVVSHDFDKLAIVSATMPNRSNFLSKKCSVAKSTLAITR